MFNLPMKNLFPSITLLSILFLLPLAFTHTNPSRTCIHDEIDLPQEVLDIPINNSTEQRMLVEYQSIRIYLDFSSTHLPFLSIKTLTFLAMVNVTDEFKNFIIDVIMPPAKNYFEAALKVKPLPGNLTLKGMTTACGSTIPIPSKYNTQGVAADLLIFVATTSDTTSAFVATAGSCMLQSGTFRYSLLWFFC